MKSVLILFLTSFFFLSCELYESTGNSQEVLADNGSMLARGEWKYTKSKKMDMYDYYQKWENSYTEYYENGTLKSSYSSSHKRSTYGRPCKELLSHYITYYPNGSKSYEQKDICDCSKSILISYSEDGNVIERKVIKTKTKKVKKAKEK